MKIHDLYTSVTQKIIEDLQSGVPSWVRPWKDSHVKGVGMIPSNLVSGRLYSGSNILLLWMTAHMRGYEALQFATYNQVNSIGASVRKGERATHIIYTKHVLRKDETGEDKPSTLVKSYAVFSVEQLDNVPDKYLSTQQPLDLELPETRLREFVNGTGIDVRFGYNRACYVPAIDSVQMPAFGAFEDEGSFAGVLCHELTHATSHPSRLDRVLGKRFGDAAYSQEELIAELGSAFMCARLGYQPSFRSASYIESWLKVLKADSRAVFSAASYAGHAADWLWSKSFGVDAENERRLEAAE